MKGFTWVILEIFFLSPVLGQTSYQAIIDVKNIVNDKASVELTVPHIKENTAIYQLPDIIPGSYALYNYTSYIDEFVAYSASGEKLPVKKNKEGHFVIKKAKTLARITYNLNDTWDDSVATSDYIFPPSGTQIEKDKVFLINHFGFLGFFRGYEHLPYSVTYIKPKDLYASTPLEITSINDTTDAIAKTDYGVLADNPVFFSNPDTLSFYVDRTKINVTTYSPNKIVTSEYLKSTLTDVSQSIKNFFGEIPITEYSFYFYFAGYQEIAITRNNSYGALEHKTSSMYFLPEIPAGKFLRSTILGIATHEFLHITTPLNLHSHEIHNFNYSEPNLSSHLWLYEGVIEYLSQWLLYKESLITKDEFIRELRQKLIQSEKYKNISFTEMSKNIVRSPYQEMYNNVYDKGALIAFLLDIEINRLTNGNKNLQHIVLTLYEKYKTTSFADDEIIDEIVAQVHPDLKKFFNDYVIGNKPIPFGDYFKMIGWDYEKEKKESLLTFGKINLSFNTELNSIFIEKSNPKQNIFHFEGGEEILSVNDTAISINNYEELGEMILAPHSEKTIVLEVKKEGKLYDMEAKPLLMPGFQQHLITDDGKKTTEQERLYRWVFAKQQSF